MFENYKSIILLKYMRAILKNPDLVNKECTINHGNMLG